MAAPAKTGINGNANASGRPVSGLVVRGAIDANPCTSSGLTWINIVSPYLPLDATSSTLFCNPISPPPSLRTG